MAGRSSVNVPHSLTPELFLQPRVPVLAEDIEEDWIQNAGQIQTIARICHPAFSVRKGLGDSLEDSGHVHLLITAEAKVEWDEDLEMATEKRNSAVTNNAPS